jgi:hypothetical protein
MIVASNIEGCLAAGDFIEAWHYLKGWYRSAEDRALKACPEALAHQTAERVELYMAVTPPGVGDAHQCHPNCSPQ